MYEYRAKIERVVDGDTVVVTVDLGFSIRSKMVLRLYGINAPELVGDPGPGRASKEFLVSLVEGRDVTIRTYKDKGDKYGRILAELFCDGDAESVNRQMIRAGFAVEYPPK
jgi:micrococcal nuclease